MSGAFAGACRPNASSWTGQVSRLAGEGDLKPVAQAESFYVLGQGEEQVGAGWVVVSDMQNLDRLAIPGESKREFVFLSDTLEAAG